MYQQNERIMGALPDSRVRSEYFQSSLERDRIINDALLRIIEDYEADGVKIIQYHNGKQDLTNVPFLYTSVTYFAGTITSDVDLYKDRPVSLIAQFNYDLWKPHPICRSFEVKKLKDASLRRQMNSHGFEFIIGCPITNADKYPIGYITAGYREVLDADRSEATIRHMSNLSSLIGGYLKTYNS